MAAPISPPKEIRSPTSLRSKVPCLLLDLPAAWKSSFDREEVRLSVLFYSSRGSDSVSLSAKFDELSSSTQSVVLHFAPIHAASNIGSSRKSAKPPR